MFCAISGEPPQVAVLSKKSGLVYEERLLRKYIDENAKDPVTGDELTQDDVIVVKSSPRSTAPRPPAISSVPALLASLQSEYDAVILESFTLKKQYDSVRQELSHALYANDAANRVVARLMVERDQAREALARIQSSLGVSSAQDTEMTDATSAANVLPADAVAKIDAASKSLSDRRKSKRKAPDGYATTADVSSFEQVLTVPSLHSTKPPGVTAMDLSGNGVLAVTGGADKQLQILDRAAGRVLATLKGHTNKITKAIFSLQGGIEIVLGSAAGGGPDAPAPAHVLSASEDKTARVWSHTTDASYSLTHTIKFGAAVTGLAIHPCGEFFGCASRDGKWAIYEVESGREILAVTPPTAGTVAEEDLAGGYVYESFAFHPDGGLLATGTAEGAVRIWDIHAGTNISTLRPDSNAGGATATPVVALSFSENGYYLASAPRGAGRVDVWDLRKTKLAGSIELDAAASSAIRDVRFDPAAQFLAVSGADVRVFANKTWKQLLTFDSNTDNVTSARWDARSGDLVVAGMDRSVRVLGRK